MNVMLASGGYPWVVIPVEERHNYMAALEKVSSKGDVAPFAKFLASLIESTITPPPAMNNRS